MSYRRKVKSSYSIYHPGISLSHEPTYNQKKGMILTRSTNLPERNCRIVTTQSLRDDANRAVKSGYVKFKNVTLKFPVDHINTEYSIDEGNIRGFLSEKLGPDVNVIAGNVTQFSIVRSSAIPVWFEINYTLDVDNATHDVTTTHYSSTSGFSEQHSAVFSTPSYSYIPALTGANRLICPRFETAGDTHGYSRVTNYSYSGLALSHDMREVLDELHSLGFNEIPYCSFGDVYPCPISTLLTFDASGVPETTTITLELSCDVYYIK